SVCGESFPKWAGNCVSCGSWNTLAETTISVPSKSKRAGLSLPKISVVPLSAIKVELKSRLKTKISEFDRVLGGGFVNGQVVLLAGEPGIGKSTLLLQVANAVATLSENSRPVLYISGEESVEQIALRAKRLNISSSLINLASETNVDSLINLLNNFSKNEKPSLVILDSIQTLYTKDLLGMSGSIGQMKECSFRVTQLAKKLGIPVVLVGHVTKEGEIAGPKVLEHIVDTVLYLEGDRNHLFRILKSNKNRFGSVDEAGVFEMDDKGMKEVLNPSSCFISERLANVSGSAITISMEGSRPFAIEVQALVSQTSFGYPRRTASGMNINRVQILCAVLEKRLSLKLSNFDVYVNIVGGLRVTDPACDLAVCLAIYSGVCDIKLSDKLAVFGEVGLSGEVRRVPHTEKRVSEAKRLGYSNVISPQTVRTVGEGVKKAQSSNVKC
ncbi:MAG: DNA repair protein RadA, partial [Patescibacteria group bacterium]